jgi:N-acyl homoserine lactone hydrolase
LTVSTVAPTRLYLMQVAAGVISMDPPLHMSAGCYLIQMSDGRHILVDSGIPADWDMPPQMQSVALGHNVIEQLAELGLAPADIDVLICSHFDIDHVGCHEAFTNAELVVQREQYEVARGGHPRFANGRAHWDHPALRYRLIDGDEEFLPGVTLLATSGHAPGHQSVLVQLPETGHVLLAIDAVSQERNFTPDRQASPMDDDEAQLLASTRKLLDLVAREQVKLVVFHHDGDQWQALKTAPEWYG